MVKYGKGILDEQFLLNRVASAAIDIYSNVVVLSRATRALNMNIPSASHEEMIARVWCNEVSSFFCLFFKNAMFIQKNYLF